MLCFSTPILTVLLGLSLSATVVEAQKFPTFPDPDAPQLEPAPVEPDTPEPDPDLSEPTRLPMRQGEIMLEGVIQAVSFTKHEFTMQAVSFTLPDGSQSVINEPRFKTVSFDGMKLVAAAPYPADGSLPNWISASQLWPALHVTVVGPDTGTGQPLVAGLIELGGRAKIDVSGFPVQKAPEKTIFYNGVLEHVAASGLRVGPMFGLTNIGGKSARGSKSSEHPRGLALDFMVGRNSKLGDTIATYFEASAGMENVKYIIWKDHLVYPGARTEWAKLPVDYGPDMTKRHMDHVHISYLDKPITVGPYLTDALIGKAKLSSRGGRRSAGKRSNGRRRR